MLLNEQKTREITEKILSFVTADDAQVSVRSNKRSNLRFARNGFLTSGNTVGHGANITVWIDRKRGSSSTSSLDADSLRAMVKQAEEIAKISPVDRQYMPTLGEQQFKKTGGYSDATANISLEKRAKQVSETIKQSEKMKVISAGFHDARANAGGFATKNGNFNFEKKDRCKSLDDGPNSRRNELRVLPAQPLRY